MELKCAEHDGLVTHIPAAEELQAARYCKRFRASYLCECCRQLRGTAGQGCWWDLVGGRACARHVGRDAEAVACGRGAESIDVSAGGQVRGIFSLSACATFGMLATRA